MPDQIRIYSAALTDAAGRLQNEDAVYSCEADIAQDELLAHGRLYAVADGTGGQAGGRTASTSALARVSESFYDQLGNDPEVDLKTAVQAAHTVLYHMAINTPSWRDMSTTFVGAVIRDGQLYVAHVGDSRAYLVHGNTLTQLTEDHVWHEDAEQYGALTRWLGGSAHPEVEVDVVKHPLAEGDVVILCSDGLTDQVDKNEAAAMVNQYPVHAAAKRLIELAKRRGLSNKSGDNVSVIIVRYGGQAIETRAMRRWAWIGGLGTIGVVILAVLVGTLSSRLSGPINTPTPFLSSPTHTLFPSPTRKAVLDIPATETQSPTTLPLTDTATPGTRVATATRAPDTPTYTPIPTPVPTNTPKHTPTVAAPATPCPGNQEWRGQTCVCPPNTIWIPDKQWCADAGTGDKGDSTAPPPRP